MRDVSPSPSVTESPSATNRLQAGRPRDGCGGVVGSAADVVEAGVTAADVTTADVTAADVTAAAASGSDASGTDGSAAGGSGGDASEAGVVARLVAETSAAWDRAPDATEIARA
jgi:hypothetical protein